MSTVNINTLRPAGGFFAGGTIYVGTASGLSGVQVSFGSDSGGNAWIKSDGSFNLNTGDISGLDVGLQFLHSDGSAALGGGELTIDNLGNTVTSGSLSSATLNVSAIPTSTSGLSAGDVWNDSGTLKIV